MGKPKTPETRGKPGYPDRANMKSRQPPAERREADGVGIGGSRDSAPRRCPSCGARVISYDYDFALDCYLGPARVDPTPLSLELAIACRLTGRNIYTHAQGRAGRRTLSRVWARQTLPTGSTILPAHICGAQTPTGLPARTRTVTPDVCPF